MLLLCYKPTNHHGGAAKQCGTILVAVLEFISNLLSLFHSFDAGPCNMTEIFEEPSNAL